uniref:Selenoprotein K n=1 Tax=Micromonas pusilla TaxID=38833 RepID=A0A7R9TK53_MICPS
MPYVSDGSVVERRSAFRLSLITDVFWRLVNVVYAFFQTMISAEYSETYAGKKRGGGKRVGGLGFGGGGGGMGGGGGGGRPGGGGGGRGGMSNVRGIDHSAASSAGG